MSDKKQTKTELIQKNILEGRKVLLVSENQEKETSLVRIRYNNTDVDGTKKWRLIISDVEYLTSEIKINCASRTLTEKFEEIGEKHHIVVDAKSIIFEKNIANIY